MAKKIRLADIAKRLNVSTVTVSKALSGQKGVSEETDTNNKFAAELGYKSDLLAGSINKIKARISGSSSQEDTLASMILLLMMYQEVATRAVQEKCFTMLEVISTDDEEKQELPRLIKEKRWMGSY